MCWSFVAARSAALLSFSWRSASARNSSFSRADCPAATCSGEGPARANAIIMPSLLITARRQITCQHAAHFQLLPQYKRMLQKHNCPKLSYCMYTGQQLTCAATADVGAAEQAGAARAGGLMRNSTPNSISTQQNERCCKHGAGLRRQTHLGCHVRRCCCGSGAGAAAPGHADAAGKGGRPRGRAAGAAPTLRRHCRRTVGSHEAPLGRRTYGVQRCNSAWLDSFVH